MKHISAAALLAGLLLAACGGSAPAAPAAALPMLELSVEARDFSYEPAMLELLAGQPVGLTLVNLGALEHDLSVMEIALQAPAVEHSPDGHSMEMSETPELHVSAQAGETGLVEFTPTQAGAYEFYCTVAGHKEAGMVGTLIVRQP